MVSANPRAIREDWISGRIKADATRIEDRFRTKFWSMVKLSLGLTALVSIPVFLIGDPELIALPVGALLLGGIPALVYYGLKFSAYLHERKFGESHFVFEPPATLGFRLEGEVETSIPIAKRPADGFDLTVVCEHRWKSTDDEGKRSSRTSTKWKDSQIVDGVVVAGSKGLVIPVSFDLPDDRNPSSGNDDEGIHWRLSVRAKMPGLDYRRRFSFPVVRAPGRRTTHTAPPSTFER